MKSIQLTKEYKVVNGIKLFQVEAVIDMPKIVLKESTFEEVHKGDKGGYVDEKSFAIIRGEVWIEQGAEVMHVHTFENSRIGKESKVLNCVLKGSFLNPRKNYQGNKEVKELISPIEKPVEKTVEKTVEDFKREYDEAMEEFLAMEALSHKANEKNEQNPTQKNAKAYRDSQIKADHYGDIVRNAETLYNQALSNS